MTRNGALQLIGFGLALAGVGLLNLAARSFDAVRFRSRFADAIRRAPDAFDEWRTELVEHEHGDGTD